MSVTFSDIQVWPTKNTSSKIRANGSVVVNNAMQFKYTLFAGPKGLFVGLPGKYGSKDNPETGKKEWYPDVSFKDPELQKELNQLVIDAYNKRVGSALNQGYSKEPSSQVVDDGLPF